MESLWAAQLRGAGGGPLVAASLGPCRGGAYGGTLMAGSHGGCSLNMAAAGRTTLVALGDPTPQECNIWIWIWIWSQDLIAMRMGLRWGHPPGSCSMMVAVAVVVVVVVVVAVAMASLMGLGCGRGSLMATRVALDPMAGMGFRSLGRALPALGD